MGRKIFCIGLNKTGTSSLHEAFQVLGINSVHYKDDKGFVLAIFKITLNVANPPVLWRRMLFCEFVKFLINSTLLFRN
jgi:hypothetical protein